MGRATIKDVAQRAGCSITTVSFVLNNKEGVSIPDSTRASILNAARALNYRPNQLAVSMVTKRTNVIGLITPDNSNSFFAELSKTIECAAHEAGYSLIYGNSENDASRDLAYIQIFADRQVDGIIFAKSPSLSSEENQQLLDFLQTLSIPVLMVDRRISGNQGYSVSSNNFMGGYLATRHLLELGHRKIGAYTGSRDIISSNERLRGYHAALQEWGVAFQEELLFEGNYQLGREAAALEHFLKHRVSAIFSFNDMMAFGLYQEIQKRQLSIPEDLSIVGFDDVFFGKLVHPTLTTVRQPIDQIGSVAVSMLLDLIAGTLLPPNLQNQVFEPTLVPRKSTAPYHAPFPDK